MRTVLVLSTVLAITSTASIAAAESFEPSPGSRMKHGYLSLGAEAGNMRTLATGLHVDGGLRLHDLPLFAHAQIGAGATGLDGSYQHARGGIEARGCVLRELACGFTGIDVGYRHDHVVDHPRYAYAPERPDRRMEPFHAHDLLAVPRAGVELGTPIKLRAAVELPLFARVDELATGRGTMFTLDMGVAF